ncbi:hypothetical protein QN367_19150, partial [Cryobacterium sp. RTS3]
VQAQVTGPPVEYRGVKDKLTPLAFVVPTPVSTPVASTQVIDDVLTVAVVTPQTPLQVPAPEPLLFDKFSTTVGLKPSIKPNTSATRARTV